MGIKGSSSHHTETRCVPRVSRETRRRRPDSSVGTAERYSRDGPDTLFFRVRCSIGRSRFTPLTNPNCARGNQDSRPDQFRRIIEAIAHIFRTQLGDPELLPTLPRFVEQLGGKPRYAPTNGYNQKNRVGPRVQVPRVIHTADYSEVDYPRLARARNGIHLIRPDSAIRTTYTETVQYFCSHGALSNHASSTLGRCFT